VLTRTLISTGGLCGALALGPTNHDASDQLAQSCEKRVGE
jgi:hypothetical protein